MNMGCDLDNLAFLISKTEEHILLRIYVQAGAKHTAFCGIYGNALRVRIRARAVENKANEELCSFLSSYFNIRKNDVHIQRGSTNRMKSVMICGNVEDLLLQCHAIML